MNKTTISWIIALIVTLPLAWFTWSFQQPTLVEEQVQPER